MKFAKLNSVKFALAGGIATAICVLITSLFYLLFGIGGMWIALIRDIYGFFGYNPTSFFGIILGTIYSFVDGFILTLIFAVIYNKIL